MYCIVDIETTGGNHKTGRITEIAIFKHDGLTVVDSYTSLVNPEQTIPYFISNLTGITNEMVQSAPRFFEIAKDIIEFTEGQIFVAHNVSFDYNFVKEEFKSLGYTFERDRICTVKSARKVFPGKRSYSLSNICKTLGITLENHHRAEGDAEATTELFKMILDANGNSHRGLMESDIRFSMMHPDMNREQLHALPEEPGVYYFMNSLDEIIYIGKSNNIKNRVASHFRNGKSRRAVEMIQQTVDVKTECTGSELIALLKESEEIKHFKPKFNRAQKRTFENIGLFVEMNEQGYLTFNLRRLGKDDTTLITTFKNLDQAKNKLAKWTEQFGLCQKYTGLYKHKGPCFGYHVGSCSGACVSEEDPELYNHRVQHATAYLQYKHNSFAVVDVGRHREENSVVLVENGTYLGYGYVDNSDPIYTIDDIKEIIEFKNDNRDTKQIIRSYLTRKRIKKLIPL